MSNFQNSISVSAYSRIRGTRGQFAPARDLWSQGRRGTWKIFYISMKRDLDFENIIYVKMKHPTQVAPQIKNTLTPKFAAFSALTPVVEGLTK
jgi:hypothetical protein